MRKWTPALLIAASYAFCAVVVGRLPERVMPRWDALFPFIVASGADAMPRAFAAFSMPTLALSVWLLIRWLASPAGERLGRKIFPVWWVSARTGAAAVERFEPTFDIIVTVVIALLLVGHAVMLGTVLGWPSWTLRGFTMLVGAGIAILGNIMPRTRPNWIAGIRTKRTLSDPDLWRRTHRWFGAMLVVTGIAMMVASLFAARWAIPVGIIGFFVSALAGVVGGRGNAPRAGGPAVSIALIALALAHPGLLGAQAQPASLAPPAGVVEHPFDVTSGAVVLPGTLTLPSGVTAPMPVVVIVAGSGPTDRNGNGPLAQTDMYAQLAHGLAARGIASVRYDKRGIGVGGLTIDHTALTLDAYVTDVTVVAQRVAADPRFSRAFLVGHSEGAGLVLQAANRGAPAAGIAMVSGMGRPLREVLHHQFSLQVDSATVLVIDTALARFVRGEDVPDAPAIARPVLVSGYRRMIASMAAYDPEAEMARSRVPLLIVQGGMDVQIEMIDAERLRAARPGVGWLVIPAANHVFKAAPSRELSVQRPLYADRSVPVVPELVEGIAAWIASVR